jgi:hypothetical protein
MTLKELKVALAQLPEKLDDTDVFVDGEFAPLAKVLSEEVGLYHAAGEETISRKTAIVLSGEP